MGSGGKGAEMKREGKEERESKKTSSFLSSSALFFCLSLSYSSCDDGGKESCLFSPSLLSSRAQNLTFSICENPPAALRQRLFKTEQK